MRFAPNVPLLAFILISCVVYLPAYHAGYVTDFTGFVPRLAEQGASGILTSYDFPALQPLLNFCFFLIYQLDGATGPIWYLVFSGLHGINAFLLFSLCRQLPFQAPRPWFPYVAAALFLLSPYQSEVVVWRVCLNYLLSTAAVLGSLLWVLRYQRSGRSFDLWIIWLLTAAGMLCFEQTLTVPFLTAALLWTVQARKQAVYAKVIGGQLFVIALYFIVLKVVLQQWIGHYGSSVHLALPLSDMLAAPLRYAGKFVLLSRYWPHEWKATWFQYTAQLYISIPLLVLALGSVLYYLRAASRQRLLAFFLLAFGLGLLPFLNLYFNFLLWIENDRYGYLASAFFYPFVILLLQQLPKQVYRLLLVAFILVNAFFLYKTLQAWQDSSRLYWALLRDFPVEEQRSTYILNLPDNLRGAPMFRSFGGPSTAFQIALQTLTGENHSAPIREVMEYNMTHPTDGVTVEPAAPDSLVVEFKQWGNWWWRHGQGGGSYENDAYRLRDKGHHYELKLQKKGLQARYLWLEEGKWQMVEF